MHPWMKKPGCQTSAYVLPGDREGGRSKEVIGSCRDRWLQDAIINNLTVGLKASFETRSHEKERSTALVRRSQG